MKLPNMPKEEMVKQIQLPLPFPDDDNDDAQEDDQHQESSSTNAQNEAHFLRVLGYFQGLFTLFAGSCRE